MTKTPSAEQRRLAIRHHQAQAQAELIERMKIECGLSVSALAQEAGFRNPTVTRPLKEMRPIGIVTLAELVSAFRRVMSNKGLAASEDVLTLIRRAGLGNNGGCVTDPTPDRLMLVIRTANEDFKLGLSDSDIEDLCYYAAELYQIIIEQERKGVAIPNNENGRAVLRRALVRRQMAKRPGQT